MTRAADNYRTVLHDELGPDGFVVRDAVPTSDVIRIRFGDIDGLRALAIVLVAFAAVVRYTAPDASPLVVRVAQAASQGLALFLVISGFALAFPAMAVLRQDGRTYIDIARYAMRRIVRIYPTYLVALILTIGASVFAQKLSPAGLQNVTPGGIIAALFFVGNGFGNVGFVALELFARAYVVFPLLLLLWTRQPAMFVALGVVLGVVDYATPLHAWNPGAFVPFMLGIVAADLRAQVHRIERFAPLLTAASAAIAIYLSTRVSEAVGAQTDGLAIDVFWSIAAFGLLVSAAAYRPIERALSFWMLRVVGASSYAISLVLVPTLACLAAFAPRYATAFSAPAILVVGFALWQLVDRWFDDSSFRRSIAVSAAGPIDAVLAKLHVARVFLGTPAVDEDEHETQEEFVPNFYAPPPRPGAADLAIVSRRTGSHEELAAEIAETKARLQERSAAMFGDLDTEFATASKPAFAKPGFYRKPPKHVDPENGIAPVFEPSYDAHEHRDPELEPESMPAAPPSFAPVTDPFAHHVDAVDDPFAFPHESLEPHEAESAPLERIAEVAAPEPETLEAEHAETPMEEAPMPHAQPIAAQVAQPQAESNVEPFTQSITREAPIAAQEKPMTVKKIDSPEPDTDAFDYAFSNAPTPSRREPTTSEIGGPSIRIRITAPTDGF